MKNELLVENLNYDILSDISFSLNGGSMTALIGNSGSGKTTLLKCLSCIPRNFSDIKLNDNVIAESRSKVSLIMGLINLSRKPVLDNVMEPLLNLEVPYLKAKNKVYKIAKTLGIELLLYKKITELSYSEKKMIAFLKAMVIDPVVILLDNIFDSLDKNFKSSILDYLKDLAEKKNAIVLFTTSSCEDLLLADNIIILKKGEIIAQGDKKKVLDNEEIFIKNGLKLPFIVDLSKKLQTYKLIDKTFYDSKKMVGELWK